MAGTPRRVRTELGVYLRRRREAIEPESLGLARGRRRVTGLRREEVATFAGVSVDYYTRLEQGREASPSPQLLSALCRVFRLSEDERLHLHRLAGADAAQQRAPLGADVSPEIQALLDRWPMNPAFVYDEGQEILAANSLGRMLHQGFSRTDNFARMMFLDPFARVFYVEWERVARATVGALRQAWGKASVRAGIQDLVDGLADADADFAEMWDAHVVIGKSHKTKRILHPAVGQLTLEYHDFIVPAAQGLHLLVCDAPPGSTTEESLRLLGSLSPDAEAPMP
ncbi:helix-turn-helix transcriptional regulator [Streptomyces zingiberis]|uniref:Helix-turn-helix domain-containing protein n=1 Tax=Streptomyces zingiberis TaxID=2053010 RepID=A0ABX1BZV4_9ACTN|nr:helix-turn-helix transcriptional regulator [Streptomyces zingiberis]NJQ03156.1 helix-turn-helix domain-containing protein [Streptomyces zingiberis]